MEDKKNVLAYDFLKANRYDKESKVIRGNRENHKVILSDILKYIKANQNFFLDLGCGTGDMTDVFFEIFPNINGYLVDGSENMLNKAKERFGSIKNNLVFKGSLLEDLNWDIIEKKTDIVFSSFAIHHIEDEKKWELYKKIYQNLTPKGVFILFDYFKPVDKRSDQLLEFIACMDIKRRIEVKLRREIDLQTVIKNDREAKDAEGDKEGSLSEHVEQLVKIGFKNVTIVFKEARLAGIIGFKN